MRVSGISKEGNAGGGDRLHTKTEGEKNDSGYYLWNAHYVPGALLRYFAYIISRVP